MPGPPPNYGDFTRKVSRGDPVRLDADFVNALSDMLQWFRAGGGRKAGASGPQAAGREDSIRVLVQNTTGQNVQQFGILGVDAPIILPCKSYPTFAERRALVGIAPQSGRSFVVTQEPIAAFDGDGNPGIGHAVILGLTPCWVFMNEIGDLTAEPAAGDTTQLYSTACGPARIVWLEGENSTASGSGEGAGSGDFEPGLVNYPCEGTGSGAPPPTTGPQLAQVILTQQGCGGSGSGSGQGNVVRILKCVQAVLVGGGGSGGTGSAGMASGLPM